MTLVSRDKRQIVGYDIAFDKSRERIKQLVDNSPKALQYYSDAYSAYSEIGYEGSHLSLKNKSQTFTVESVNFDLKHIFLLYVAVLNVFLDLWRPCYLCLKFSCLHLTNLLLLNLISLQLSPLCLFLLLSKSSFWALLSNNTKDLRAEYT